MNEPADRLRQLLGRVRARGQRLLVLGVGNDMLGDDAIGVLIARDLEALSSETFLAVPVGIGVENAGHLIPRHRADVVLIFDAVAAPGRTPWLFVPPSRLDTFCHSTHSVPLSLLIRAWRQDSPTIRVHFIGIRPRLVALGAPLSPAVQAVRAEIVGVFEERST
ncbi:MAG TPA: hydrogenase maturation protease [Thermoanaerobaculaceae bacterium]|nr:hydrogenase maturation protease [Thermoanaerobaculaceae bacterium]HPS77339.1 hydrogenase maturation protease [Thermoanaerobaculaceae bacterium]